MKAKVKKKMTKDNQNSKPATNQPLYTYFLK